MDCTILLAARLHCTLGTEEEKGEAVAVCAESSVSAK